MAVPLPRRGIALPVTAAVLVLTAACGGSPPPRPAEPTGSATVSARELQASITQNRFDEASGALLAGITNHTDHAIRVSRASVRWSGFTWPEVDLDPTPVLPGQTAPFHISPGRADCTGRPSDPPVLTATVDGTGMALPLSVDVPGLLPQLHQAACAGQALAVVAHVRLTVGTREVTRRGAPYLSGAVDLRRRPGSHDTVAVVDVLGSVLFDLLPRRALPDTLTADSDHLRVPVLVGPTRRCDPHARGQASQPFLFAVFTRLSGEQQHRTITVPIAAEQRRLNALLDRACR